MRQSSKVFRVLFYRAVRVLSKTLIARMHSTSSKEARVPDPLAISGLIVVKGGNSACVRFTRWFYTQHRTVQLSGCSSRKHCKPKVVSGISSETEATWEPSMLGTKECLCGRIVNANKKELRHNSQRLGAHIWLGSVRSIIQTGIHTQLFLPFQTIHLVPDMHGRMRALCFTWKVGIDWGLENTTFPWQKIITIIKKAISLFSSDNLKFCTKKNYFL